MADFNFSEPTYRTCHNEKEYYECQLEYLKALEKRNTEEKEKWEKNGRNGRCPQYYLRKIQLSPLNGEHGFTPYELNYGPIKITNQIRYIENHLSKIEIQQPRVYRPLGRSVNSLQTTLPDGRSPALPSIENVSELKEITSSTSSRSLSSTPSSQKVSLDSSGSPRISEIKKPYQPQYPTLFNADGSMNKEVYEQIQSGKTTIEHYDEVFLIEIPAKRQEIIDKHGFIPFVRSLEEYGRIRREFDRSLPKEWGPVFRDANQWTPAQLYVHYQDELRKADSPSILGWLGYKLAELLDLRVYPAQKLKGVGEAGGQALENIAVGKAARGGVAGKPSATPKPVTPRQPNAPVVQHPIPPKPSTPTTTQPKSSQAAPTKGNSPQSSTTVGVGGTKPTTSATEQKVAEEREGIQSIHRKNQAKDSPNANPLGQVPSNVATLPKLNVQLLAEQISKGHAYQKHVLGVNNENGQEFKSLKITTPEQFAKHIEFVVSNPTDVRYTKDGRAFYIHEPSRTVVIHNPQAPDGGTAFRPNPWNDYYEDKIPNRNTPYE